MGQCDIRLWGGRYLWTCDCGDLKGVVGDLHFLMKHQRIWYLVRVGRISSSVLVGIVF